MDGQMEKLIYAGGLLDGLMMGCGIDEWMTDG